MMCVARAFTAAGESARVVREGIRDHKNPAQQGERHPAKMVTCNTPSPSYTSPALWLSLGCEIAVS